MRKTRNHFEQEYREYFEDINEYYIADSNTQYKYRQYFFVMRWRIEEGKTTKCMLSFSEWELQRQIKEFSKIPESERKIIIKFCALLREHLQEYYA